MGKILQCPTSWSSLEPCSAWFTAHGDFNGVQVGLIPSADHFHPIEGKNTKYSNINQNWMVENKCLQNSATLVQKKKNLAGLGSWQQMSFRWASGCCHLALFIDLQETTCHQPNACWLGIGQNWGANKATFFYLAWVWNYIRLYQAKLHELYYMN